MIFLSYSMCTLLVSLGQSVGACPGKLVGWVCRTTNWQNIWIYWYTEVICVRIAMATSRGLHEKYVKNIFILPAAIFTCREYGKNISNTRTNSMLLRLAEIQMTSDQCDQLQYSYIRIFDQLVLNVLQLPVIGYQMYFNRYSNLTCCLSSKTCKCI